MAGKTAKTGRKVEKVRVEHSAAAPQSQKTLGKNARISKNTITAWM
jgi:DNA-binding XRE family transcriptional regulator